MDVVNYHQTFHHRPECLIYHGGVLSGFWWIGAKYQREKGYYGEYPPGYLERIRALFTSPGKVLHLFAGMVKCLPGEATFDLNPELNPTIVGNAETLSTHFSDEKFSLILADPPYNKEHATKYGFRLPNKPRVFREARKIIVPGGYLVWLDLRAPIYRSFEWTLVGTIGVYCGTNKVVRIAFIFRATPDNVWQKGLSGPKNRFYAGRK